MMRWMAMILALASCAPAVQTGHMAYPSNDTGGTAAPIPMPCQEALVVDQVGKRFDPAGIDAVRDRARARTVRVVRPGDAVTMDHRPDRLNIQLDGQDRIAQFRCG